MLQTLKWLAKISAVSLLMVSPMIFLMYKSSLIIDQQMDLYMSGKAEIQPGESLQALNTLTLNMGVAYTYTFILGATLILYLIYRLVKKFYIRCRDFQRDQNLLNTADGARVEGEIEEAFDAASLYEYQRKLAIKVHNRGRSGLAEEDAGKGNSELSNAVESYLKNSENAK